MNHEWTRMVFHREKGGRREEKVVRGHYAVGFRRVGRREEGGEGSAGMARVGAPCVRV